jgi:hypothetical protein
MNAANADTQADADQHRAHLKTHLAKARDLVCLANRKGLQVDQDVLGVLVRAARTCAERGQIDLNLETRFWEAYSSLRQTIPAARLARALFLVALGVMLLFQCYFLFGSRVHEEFGRLRTEETQLLGERAKAAGNPDEAGIAQAIEQNRMAQAAYRDLALWLAPYRLLIAPDGKTTPGDGFEVAFAALRMMLDFLAAYVLPALYGLLGACAFVLRQLCADLSTNAVTRRIANDSRIRYSMRLCIGVIGGLAVGWFVDPTQEGSVVANLSPLALAFVAGYGSDLLFAVLDRIVTALAGPLSAATAEGAQDPSDAPISERQGETAGQRPATTWTDSDAPDAKRAGTNGVHAPAAPAPAG